LQFFFLEIFVRKWNAVLTWFSFWAPPIIIMVIIFGFSSMSGGEVGGFADRFSQTRIQVLASFATQRSNLLDVKTKVPSPKNVKPIVITQKPVVKASQFPKATALPTHTPSPTRYPTATPTPSPVSPLAGYFDIFKFGHIFWFALLGLALQRAFMHKLTWNAATLSAVTACAIYAGLDEFHQSFVVGRDPLVADVFLDTTAAIIILEIQAWVARNKRSGFGKH
jgi:VanZ family protein